jgi:hypothetical protein
MVDVTEEVGEGLDLLTVVQDGHITLDHGVELIGKEDGMRFLVVVEEVRNRSEELAGRLIISHISQGEIQNERVNKSVQPALDIVVMSSEQVIGLHWNRGIEVGKEVELAYHCLEEVAPPAKVRACKFKGDGYMCLHVDGVEWVEKGGCNIYHGEGM